jgi:AraC-like DNA-binding protein
MILLPNTVRKDPEMTRADSFFHYLPVNEEAMSSGIYVTGAGRAAIQPGDKYPPSGHPVLYQFDWSRGRTLPEFQLVLVTGGAGEFESKATGNIRFEGSALFTIVPGVWHRFRPTLEVGWNERWLSFNGAMLEQLFGVDLFAPNMAVTRPRDAERLGHEFDELLERIHRRSAGHPGLLTLQALRIISDAVAQRVEDAIDSGRVPRKNASTYCDDPIVQRALEMIWTHGNYPMSVSDIARQLPVTRRTLDRRFVEATGRSVLEEINACRLSRAKRLLSETDLPVKTVAHLAGFNSTERMRVLFIEREGTSPTAYRKQAVEARSARRKLVQTEQLLNGANS